MPEIRTSFKEDTEGLSDTSASTRDQSSDGRPTDLVRVVEAVHLRDLETPLHFKS